MISWGRMPVSAGLSPLKEFGTQHRSSYCRDSGVSSMGSSCERFVGQQTSRAIIEQSPVHGQERTAVLSKSRMISLSIEAQCFLFKQH